MELAAMTDGQPSELAHRIREQMRAEHARCGDNVKPQFRSCFLALLHAEDIQAILDSAAARSLTTEEARMAEVLIDGVRYVPLNESNPAAFALMRSLVEQYMGDGQSPQQIVELARELHVVVGEPDDEFEGETVEEFVARLFGGAPDA
jgi:hypothetical protein